MNVKHILCPVDFSEHADAALDYATALATQYKAELHIVYVYEEPVAYVDAGFAGYVAPADLGPDEERLAAVKPNSPDVLFRRKLLVGHPARRLVEYSRDEGIDLIVMATHGRTGLGRLLMGSVAEEVVRHADCPVLTIRRPLPETEPEQGTETAGTAKQAPSQGNDTTAK